MFSRAWRRLPFFQSLLDTVGMLFLVWNRLQLFQRLAPIESSPALDMTQVTCFHYEFFLARCLICVLCSRRYYCETGDVQGTLGKMPGYKVRETLVLKALHRHGTDMVCSKSGFCFIYLFPHHQNYSGF